MNIEKYFMDGKQTKGLAKIVLEVYNKKFSKYNQESAWTNKPLRRGQIHYAALDAVSVLYILKKYREDNPVTEEDRTHEVVGESITNLNEEKLMSSKNKEEYI